MRLLSCRIENFGKLSNQTFDFSQNPTTIFEKNGWGKTTLAAFLRCMFYGMPDSRTKSAEGNLRLKYKPWQGGVYGGSLTFEEGGKTYLVRRVFGDTPKGDDYKLYDAVTHLPTEAFGRSQNGLGTALFGVDEDGYEKLVYLPQGSVEIRLDGGLQAALLRSRESLDGGEDVEKAVERIEAEERLLRAKRKPAKGRLDVLDEEIYAVEEQLFAAEKSSEYARVLQEKIQRIDREIAEQKSLANRKNTHQKDSSSPTKKGKKILMAVCFIVGALALLLGAVSLLPMPIAIALGIVGAGVGVCLSLFLGKESTKKAESSSPPLLLSIESLLEQKHALEMEGQAYFATSQKILVLQEKLADCKREKERLEKRAWRLSTAKAMLIEAKNRSTGDCLQPLGKRVQTLFAEFYPGKRTVLTAEGEMRLDEAGALREGAYYSAGMRAALGICIRLALVETLFERSLPPLILDDPFVDMDEENMNQAKLFVKSLQKKYQIVYLTCHESRRL